MAYSITVDLSSRRLTLYKDGSTINSYPVGIGKMLTPTPTGTYSIINKQPNPGGAFGAMWMGLSKPSYGIHGTNDPSSIGSLVSHGCIRMYNRKLKSSCPCTSGLSQEFRSTQIIYTSRACHDSGSTSVLIRLSTTSILCMSFAFGHK